MQKSAKKRYTPTVSPLEKYQENNIYINPFLAKNFTQAKNGESLTNLLRVEAFKKQGLTQAEIKRRLSLDGKKNSNLKTSKKTNEAKIATANINPDVHKTIAPANNYIVAKTTLLRKTIFLGISLTLLAGSTTVLASNLNSNNQNQNNISTQDSKGVVLADSTTATPSPTVATTPSVFYNKGQASFDQGFLSSQGGLHLENGSIQSQNLTVSNNGSINNLTANVSAQVNGRLNVAAGIQSGPISAPSGNFGSITTTNSNSANSSFVTTTTTGKAVFEDKVGINTKNPQGELHIVGQSNYGGNADIILEPNNDQALKTWDIAAESTGRFTIYDWSNNKNPFYIEGNAPNDSLYIASNGKVGFGTMNPQGEIQIGDRFTLHSRGYKGIAYNFWYDGTNNQNGTDRYILNDYASGYFMTDTGSLYLSVAPNGTANSPITWNRAMVINNSGNVGIGTTNPTRRLEVPWLSGDITSTSFFGSSNSSNDQVAIIGTSYSSNGVYGSSTNSVGVTGNSINSVGVQGGSNLGVSGLFQSNLASNAFATLVTKQQGAATADLFQAQNNAGTALVNITSGGNVGIGTTSPAAKLDVNGSANFGATTVTSLSLSSTINGSLYTTNWTNVTFATNWSNNGSGYQNVQYKKVGDLVFIRGLATSNANAWNANTTIFTLPAGFRPSNRLVFSQIMAGNTAGRVDILSTGEVQWNSGGSGSGIISLDSIVFSVD